MTDVAIPYPDKVASDAAKNPDSRAILHAYRFLEGTVEQIEALRDAIDRELQSPASVLEISGFKFVLQKKNNDDACDKTGWICRSTLDTFEIRRRAQGSERLFRGAVQISVAPTDPKADDNFFPHVAIIIFHNDRKLIDPTDDFSAEEDFILDDDYLKDRQNFRDDDSQYDDASAWKYVGNLRWLDDSGCAVSTFVVPLLDLSSTEDVRSKIVERLKNELVELSKLL